MDAAVLRHGQQDAQLMQLHFARSPLGLFWGFPRWRMSAGYDGDSIWLSG
jgi:hypothetical protein